MSSRRTIRQQIGWQIKLWFLALGRIEKKNYNPFDIIICYLSYLDLNYLVNLFHKKYNKNNLNDRNEVLFNSL